MKPVSLDGFRFKQFSIEHRRCAMKVGTDGILLGSWVPKGAHKRVLDIGTGSGLLAIMMAQKTLGRSRILGIDIESNAVEQAIENGKQCPWPQKLDFQHCALQALKGNCLFDVIVSNPPFFSSNKSFTSDHDFDANPMTPQRRLARHNTALTLEELLANVHRLLTIEGLFYCVLPADLQHTYDLVDAAKLFIHKQTTIHSVAHKPAKRQLLCLGKQVKEIQRETLVIQTANGQYTEAYRNLCADYYLNF